MRKISSQVSDQRGRKNSKDPRTMPCSEQWNDNRRSGYVAESHDREGNSAAASTYGTFIAWVVCGELEGVEIMVSQTRA